MARPLTIFLARTRLVSATPRTDWCHVLLETDAGLTGTGEATLDPIPVGFVAELGRAACALVGRKVDRATLAPLSALLDQGLPERTIHSALDQAVSDLLAQEAGVPLYRFLLEGAAGAPVALYANINRATSDRTPHGFASSATRALAQGHKSLKIAAFDGLTPKACGTHEGDVLIEAGLARLRAVARNGLELRLDCHWRLTFETALALLPRLAEIGVTWIECPLAEKHDAIYELRLLRAAANRLGIRMAGLETFGGWDTVAAYVEGGAYDVIMPDVKHVGRLRHVLDIADHAARHGVTVSLHNPSGPVAHIASTHVALALNGDERMEIQWNESPRFFDIIDPAPRIVADHCHAPNLAGLGARLVSEASSDEDAPRT